MIILAISLPVSMFKANAATNDITIAMVDTGVDLQHPDLKQYLVNGTNLVKPGSSPMDDNGHGTNVAGVIKSIAFENISDTLNWKPRIMPIKALDVEGTGDEQRLGQGIDYAVNHGARIVLLSLGLNKFSSYLSNVVLRAEAQGVLLVAASGNEGAAVKYPAAYSTVLAVGGIAPSNKIENLSNFGSELDVVAPWNVYTTAKGGGYENQEGTSMAAPQVAAVCALIWSKYPDMKPSQIRNLIRQTAQDIGQKGWDIRTGYGLLQAARALKDKPLDDIYEPNDRLDRAAILPLGKKSEAVLTSKTDTDWFIVDAPYNGSLQIEIQSNASASSAVEMTHFKNRTQAGKTYTEALSKGVSFQVSKGRNYLRLRSLNASVIKYQIYPQFFVNPDAFEDNDRKFKAFVLPARSQVITGTLHQNADQDWFMMPITQAGTLRLKLATDTSRIDSVLRIEKSGEKTILIDQKSDGQTETSLPIEVTPGNYYFLISNVKDYNFPIVGEYTLQIDYTKRFVDPNEPNDRSFQATGMRPSVKYEGVLDDKTDEDWFSFIVKEESLVKLELGNIPVDRKISLTLQNYALKVIKNNTNTLGRSKINIEAKLQPGKYYIHLSVNESFHNQLYHLQVEMSPMLSGFSDISAHWAKASIVKLVNLDVIQGYGNDRFAPNQSITRAEAVSMLNQALKWKAQMTLSYSDVVKSDWYYAAIAKGAAADVVSGYPDGSFKPNRALTRMEMTAMLAHAGGGKAISTGISSFHDIQADYWGTHIISWMEAKGWVSGYHDGTFQPERQATRAEFAHILVKVMND
jgi:hypothetical protein